jgi:hypothetical protein
LNWFLESVNISLKYLSTKSNASRIGFMQPDLCETELEKLSLISIQNHKEIYQNHLAEYHKVLRWHNPIFLCHIILFHMTFNNREA